MRALVAVAMALALAGCGWHLRGAQSVSLDGQRIAVVDETRTRPLVRAVNEVLGDLGAQAVDAEAPADARLRLVSEGFSRRTLAGAGPDGVAEYELSYQIRFQVLGPEGETWSQPEIVRSASSYEVDEANVLAGESRRDELSEYLREDVARLMAARLQAAVERNRGGE